MKDTKSLVEFLKKYVIDVVYENEDTEDMTEYLYNPLTNTIHIYPYAVRIGLETLSLLRAFGGFLSKGKYKSKYLEENEQTDLIFRHMKGAIEQVTAVVLANLHSISLTKTEQAEMWNKLYLHMVGLSKTV